MEQQLKHKHWIKNIDDMDVSHAVPNLTVNKYLHLKKNPYTHLEFKV